jgi:diguanylate cyclase (GGDEF)-like protein
MANESLMDDGFQINEGRKKGPLILIVDDLPRNLQVLANTLSRENYQMAAAVSGYQVFELLNEIIPDLILLDIAMPGMDGYEVCEKLKADSRFKDIPVIFLTAKNDTEDIVRGFGAGAVDYVTKPFHTVELLARVKTHLELKRSQEALKKAYDELRIANQQLAGENQKLLSVQKMLEIAACTDALTRISNRRHMIEKIDYEVNRAERSGKPFVLVLSDIDNFKRINDEYGHDCGDYVLVNMAAAIKSMLRKQDHIGRWGGEEFLFILPETDLSGGEFLSEKIRKALNEKSYEYNGIQLSVSMTFGVSQYQLSQKDIRSCLKMADEALYLGKQKGKNCVMVFAPPQEEKSNLDADWYP